MHYLKSQKIWIKICLLVGLFCLAPQQTEAQFFKKLIKKAEKKIEDEAEKRSQKRVDDAIDKGFDEVENEIDGKSKKPEVAQQEGQQPSKQMPSPQEGESPQNQDSKPDLQWSRFDFVPGDTVIFEDGPAQHEENGEFPSRWDLFEGGAEIAQLDGEPVIYIITDSGNMYRKGIVPYLKDAKEDYLPEVFTIEYDVYYPANEYNRGSYVTLYDRKNQKRNGIPQIEVDVNAVEVGNSNGTLAGLRSNKDAVGGWRHVSIAYTKGKLKVYLQDQRLINIPRLEGNPTGITISTSHEGMYLKNIRIAKGGVKYYDRVLSEGKIVVNGIKFDVNKASLRPESMGPINTIFQLMQKQADLNFSVEGHTDSDGADTANQTLSEARAKAVMEKLIAMGIAPARLTSKGFGESKPLDTNATPEGKANNRRVEFVKF
ncbi:OmpA family protein [Sediminicola luteus]|nr:OmpA family protein [Sediminicola luteus]